MPLLRGFRNYMDWETDTRRWAMMLYSRAIRMEVDYFINSANDIEASILDKNAGGFPKRKLEAKVGENEKAIIKGGNYDPVSYEWAFNVLWGKFREPDGAPIVRIAGKLSGDGGGK